jgi:hypothetical protein
MKLRMSFRVVTMYTGNCVWIAFFWVRCESFLSVARAGDDKADKTVKYEDLTIEIQRM